MAIYQHEWMAELEGGSKLTPKAKLTKRENGRSRKSWNNTADPMMAALLSATAGACSVSQLTRQ